MTERERTLLQEILDKVLELDVLDQGFVLGYVQRCTECKG